MSASRPGVQELLSFVEHWHGAPDIFSFCIGEHGGPSHLLEWRDSALMYCCGDGLYWPTWNGNGGIQPSDQAWADFYQAATVAGVGNWRLQYWPQLPVLDGRQWSLQLQLGDLHIESNGNNAYPPEHQWHGFLRAVSDLVGYEIK